MSEITALLDRISVFGSINALVIGIFILSRKDKTRSGLFLGILLILLAITNIRSFLMHVSLLSDSWIFNTGFLHTTSWWTVLFFFFVSDKFGYGTHKQKRFYFLPILGTLLHLAFLAIENREISFLLKIGRYNAVYEAITFAIYVFLTIRLLKSEKAAMRIRRKLLPIVTIFILYAFSYPLVSILFTLQVKIFIDNWNRIYIPLLFFESFTSFFFAVFSLTEIKRFRYYFEGNSDKRSSYLNKSYIQIIETDKLYLDEDLTLDSLAIGLNTTSRNLSESIQAHTSLTFNKYINQLRVKAFKEKVKIGRHKKLSIVGVAKESGFKSKATFNRVFKNHEGKTPSDYIKAVDMTL